MPNVIQNVHPKDLTMSLPSNYIENEKKLFANASDRIFVPDGGPFYSQSLLLKDNNGVLLKPVVDYKLLYLNEEATIESGRDVVAVIWIMKETLPYVMIDYRVVGGAYGNTVNAIMQEITNAGPIKKNVDWNINVFSKPSQFPAAPHYHTPDTFTDWSMIYTQLEGIRKAIVVGDDVSWESHYNYVDRTINNVRDNISSDLNNYATKTYLAAQLNAIDVAVDLSGYYNKAEVDSRLTEIDVKAIATASNLGVNYYTKVQADGKYPLKTDNYTKVQSDATYALKTDSYTKVDSDAKYATKSQLTGYTTTNDLNNLDIKLTNQISGATGGSVDLSGYYTKLQAYAKTEVYNKGETYSKSETYSRTEIDNKLATIDQNITNAITSFIPTYRIVNKSVSYTLVAADLKGDTIVRCTSDSTSTVTLPAIGNGMVIGTVISIRQVGTGAVTIATASGVTISPNDSLSLRRAGITATLMYVANNSFDLITELQ